MLVKWKWNVHTESLLIGNHFIFKLVFMPRPGSALVRSEVFTPRRSSFAPRSTRLTSLHPSLQWQMTGPYSSLCEQVSYYNLLCIITSPKQNKNTYKSLKHSQYLTEVFTPLELFHIFVMPQTLLHKLTQKSKITLFFLAFSENLKSVACISIQLPLFWC